MLYVCVYVCIITKHARAMVMMMAAVELLLPAIITRLHPYKPPNAPAMYSAYDSAMCFCTWPKACRGCPKALRSLAYAFITSTQLVF